MLEGDDVSRLLDILGNKNRRRIIQLLRQKPCFVTEISDRLMLSPKAVIEHLSMMEREDILEFRSDINRRKYYYLSKDFRIMIDLESVRAKIPSEILQNTDIIGRTVDKIKSIQELMDSRANLISDLEYLERDIDKKIRELKVSCKGLLDSETEVNLVLALASYEMDIVSLEEFLEVPGKELFDVLEGLTAKGIVERTGNLYRVCELYGK
ncbi:ArsR family transcriptional regulator [Methanomicrobium antiquum]|uniref:ArsR family transcriptional regulator n=1 Tax=Methanomicrobium antiquum TaxID=487686 RepID=A0AAF0FVH2_9EURY|nr:ArsR family transcriptional regulator [Methanomicrobium antiquum]MDD3977772.1 ArsR family transcriptional regulator [Methanomicrobium sp.]WFN37163.1 ArsR family transcriptional regulator [Methanomicrobium antiquum]